MKPSPRRGSRLTVRFWPTGGKDKPRVGYTTNVSDTGMFIATIRPLPPGTQLVAEVKLPNKTFQQIAVVVHASRVAGPLQQFQRSGMGVRFLS